MVTIRGELDLFTTPRPHEALAGALDLGARRLVVDLAKVSFIDSIALGVLIAVGKKLRVAEGSLDLVCQDGDVRRMLELTGLDCVFVINARLQEALSAARSG